ncbi:unnamed protein product, partial [marine sediment metagenome]
LVASGLALYNAEKVSILKHNDCAFWEILGTSNANATQQQQ